MIEFILKKPEIAAWVFNGLIAMFGILLSVLFGIAIYYFKEQRREHIENGKKISKVRGEYFTFRTTVNKNLEKIHSSGEDLWKEINKVRRALASGTMVLRRRKEEIIKIVEDQRRTKYKVAKHTKIHWSEIKALKRHRSRLALMDTEILEIKENLIMIKNKRNNSSNT